ncbi:GNAT family N-acetyltransferase [Parablautia muri]|uniref:GNAT family N-acetyltransferase n=1 Tax=Parablautia muri TaxID=2320879 RepID=A0A9X5BFI7_9FIRM|nr:GNAT family N-acetyltransferase [Parablautia muri]NBJ93109.1 GNAT family N-acetyltransferase [Parablautia muri]
MSYQTLPHFGEKFTNEDIWQIAMEQSAIDINCRAADFLGTEHVIVPFALRTGARKYYKEPIACNLVSYGNNIVASVTDGLKDMVETYIGKFEFYHCFETPNMHWLDSRLREKGQTVCFMAEYYLPDLKRLHCGECNYELKVLEQSDFGELYTPQWRNALCEDRKQLDVLGIGAFDAGKLVGLAGCSADCDTMWQIGVDVLPDYRKKGIASALTSRLAIEILNRGKVPFYCSAWSNIRSVRNAIRSGFVPAWVEMTTKPIHVVEEMNNTTSSKNG